MSMEMNLRVCIVPSSFLFSYGFFIRSITVSPQLVIPSLAGCQVLGDDRSSNWILKRRSKQKEIDRLGTDLIVEGATSGVSILTKLLCRTHQQIMRRRSSRLAAKKVQLTSLKRLLIEVLGGGRSSDWILKRRSEQKEIDRLSTDLIVGAATSSVSILTKLLCRTHQQIMRRRSSRLAAEKVQLTSPQPILIDANKLAHTVLTKPR